MNRNQLNRNRKYAKILIKIWLIIGSINALVTYVIIPCINTHQSIQVVSPSHWFGGGGFYGSTLMDISKTNDDHVHIKCRVTLKNLSDFDQEVCLAALMPYEMLMCVNKSILVYAKKEDHVIREVFYLKAHQEKTFENVIFCDESRGCLLKMNRLFPWVVALPINSL